MPFFSPRFEQPGEIVGYLRGKPITHQQLTDELLKNPSLLLNMVSDTHPAPQNPRPNRVAFVECDYCRSQFDPLANAQKCPQCGASKRIAKSAVPRPMTPPTIKGIPTNNPGTH